MPEILIIRIDEHNIFDVPLAQARRIYTELTMQLETIHNTELLSTCRACRDQHEQEAGVADPAKGCGT